MTSFLGLTKLCILRFQSCDSPTVFVLTVHLCSSGLPFVAPSFIRFTLRCDVDLIVRSCPLSRLYSSDPPFIVPSFSSFELAFVHAFRTIAFNLAIHHRSRPITIDFVVDVVVDLIFELSGCVSVNPKPPKLFVLFKLILSFDNKVFYSTILIGFILQHCTIHFIFQKIKFCRMHY